MLGKQSCNKSKPIISTIRTEQNILTFNTDTILDNLGDISSYISKYFENVYSEHSTDESKQNWFLSFIDKSVDDSDNLNLIKYITENEIFEIMETFNQNKSPGIDGLPIEFYL